MQAGGPSRCNVWRLAEKTLPSTIWPTAEENAAQGWTAASSRYGEGVAPIFVDRGAPFRVSGTRAQSAAQRRRAPFDGGRLVPESIAEIGGQAQRVRASIRQGTMNCMRAEENN